MSRLHRIHALAVALALTALATPGAACAQSNGAQFNGAGASCEGCHATRSEARLRAPVHATQGDAHDAAGVGCVDCHGGDPEDETARAHSLVLGFVGIPDAVGTLRFCGRCHDGSREGTLDVRTDHRAGAHGRAIAMGSTHAATCTSCHGAHGIPSVGDPDAPTAPSNVALLCEGCHASRERLGGTDLDVDVAADYRRSVHGLAAAAGNLEAPTCVSCHGPHDNAAGLRATLACGTCHEDVRAAFASGPHAAAFERLGFVDCAECHGDHDIRAADATLLAGLGSTCSRCHGPNEEVAARVASFTAAAPRLDTLHAERARDDPTRRAAMVALHRLDAEALDAALAGVGPAAPSPVVEEEPEPEAPSSSGERWGLAALAVGLATVALGLFLRARRSGGAS